MGFMGHEAGGDRERESEREAKGVMTSREVQIPMDPEGQMLKECTGTEDWHCSAVSELRWDSGSCRLSEPLASRHSVDLRWPKSQ